MRKSNETPVACFNVVVYADTDKLSEESEGGATTGSPFEDISNLENQIQENVETLLGQHDESWKSYDPRIEVNQVL